MTRRIAQTELAQIARIAPVAPAPAHTVDRSFELPTGLYVATVGAYFAFLAVMATAFTTGELLIPMAIFVIFITGMFGVPALWVKMQPDNPTRALDWGRFQGKGIQTATGHLRAGEAAVQMLILPVLILVWGVIVAVIAALT